ncbi:MAG: ORF6N domain-containing protein [Kiritimatiellae bacterium]|nr:ORF6N domain-containing protein [Kiritimatiellia bacterium]MDD5522793.1 ORF6N domain-containing protein [Kiritimatiellia bacterium]
MIKESDESTYVIPIEQVQSTIFLLRGQRVMLDADLAVLYGVETKALKRAVNRNRDRFPSDFMFVLTPQEFTNLRCQIGTSSERHGGRRHLPYAFTEQGVAMLSSVLRSNRAIHVNIAIMRAFVQLREVLNTSKTLALKLKELEDKISSHDESIRTLFEAIRELMMPSETSRKQIGFHVKESRARYGTRKSRNDKRIET